MRSLRASAPELLDKESLAIQQTPPGTIPLLETPPGILPLAEAEAEAGIETLGASDGEALSDDEEASSVRTFRGDD